MNSKIHSVAVFLHRKSKASRDQASGVFRYAAKHEGWDLHIFTRPENKADLKRLVSFLGQKPDGIISGKPDVIFALREKFDADIPAVVIDYNASDRTKINGCLFCDDHLIARQAADFLLPRKFAAYAYAGVQSTREGDSDTFLSQNRENGFRRCLAKAGHTLCVYSEKLPRDVGQYQDVAALAQWLKALPKPCAILAFSDAIARSVASVCRKCRIPIPLQVTVLGIDNETELCENSHPTLSSIEPDFIAGGFDAAEMLDTIMRTAPGQRRTLRAKYGIIGITERMSTRSVTGERIRVSKALEIIRKRATDGLTAQQLADELGVSPRLLELAFRNAARHTVRDEILSVKLNEATRLLRSTRLHISEIAARCGFRTDGALKAIFAKRFGCSMRTWRKKTVKAD